MLEMAMRERSFADRDMAKQHISKASSMINTARSAVKEIMDKQDAWVLSHGRWVDKSCNPFAYISHELTCRFRVQALN